MRKINFFYKNFIIIARVNFGVFKLIAIFLVSNKIFDFYIIDLPEKYFFLLIFIDIFLSEFLFSDIIFAI